MHLKGLRLSVVLALLSGILLMAGCAKKEEVVVPPAAPGAAQATPAPVAGHTATELQQVQSEDDRAAKGLPGPK